MAGAIELAWSRPESSEYPSEYGIDFMARRFCKDEPICQALDVPNDIQAIEDFKLSWKTIIKQKMVLVCFKNGSDQIVGMNSNYVKCKEDNFMQVLYTQIKSDKIRKYADLMYLLRENFNIFDVYGLDKHLSCIGLVVDKAYRRRGIAEQILRCRRKICEAFSIPMTTTVLTADSSNRIADKVGFKLDKIIRYDDLRNTHPHIKLPHNNSDAVAIKSILF